MPLVPQLGRFRRPAASLVDQGLVSLSNFLTVVLFARDLDPASFGLVALVLTSAQMVMAFLSSLVGDVHNVLGPARDERGFASLTASMTGLLLALAASVGVLCALVAVVGNAVGSSNLWTSFPVGLAVVTSPWMVQDGIRRMLYTSRRMGAILATDAATYGLQAAGAVALTAGALPATFEAAVGVMAASSAAGAAVAVACLYRIGIRAGTRAWRRDLGESWALARYLVTGEAMRTAQGGLTTWVVATVAGLPALGAYRAAVQIVNVLNPIQHALSLYWPAAASARWVRSTAREYRSWFRRSAGGVLWAYAAVAVAIAALAAPLLDLAYNQRYAGHPMVALVVVSAVGRVFLLSRSLAHMGLVAARRPGIVVTDALLEAGLLTILGLPLILSYGVQGAAAYHALVGLILGAYAIRRFEALGEPGGTPVPSATTAEADPQSFRTTKPDRNPCRLTRTPSTSSSSPTRAGASSSPVSGPS